ncbi:DUF6538 domain-containing protein [Methylobacterium sp. J-077]|uniref:DUF6538 domain-containing protein n=1 Tax=Methylobacterium sp. J-077 TaxID=2836656 RepID=UPI00391B361A
MPCSHIRRRGQTVLLRRITTHDLRLWFGQREILRSLGHATPGEARRLAQRLWDARNVVCARALQPVAQACRHR